MNRLDLFLSEIKEIGFTTGSYSSSSKEFVLLPDIGAPRWMIPLQDGVDKANAMLIYEPTTAKGRLFKKVVSLMPNSICRAVLKNNRISVEIDDDWIKNEYGIKDPSYSFYLGNRGPHNKVTIQVSENDVPKLYMKITGNSEILGLFKNESDILGFLNRTSLKEFIPGYIRTGKVKDIYLLAISTERTKRSAVEFSLTEKHVDFLTMLYKISDGQPLSNDSSYFMKCSELLSKFVEQNKECEWLMGLYIKAECTVLESGLKSCICHRDFTPWNIYFNDEKISVFDWEYSSKDYLPFFDILHFITQTSFLASKITDRLLLEEIRKNRNLKMYAEGISASEKVIDAFCVLYLLDVLFLYEFRTNSMNNDDIFLKNRRIGLLKLLEEVV